MSGVNAHALVGGQRGPASLPPGLGLVWKRSRAVPFPLARAACLLAGASAGGGRLLFGSAGPDKAPRLAAWAGCGAAATAAAVLLEVAASAVGCALGGEGGGGGLALTALAVSPAPLTWPAVAAVDVATGGVTVGEGVLAATAVRVVEVVVERAAPPPNLPLLALSCHARRPRPHPVAALAPAAADADAYVVHPAHWAAALALGGAGRRLAAAEGVGLPPVEGGPLQAWATGAVGLLVDCCSAVVVGAAWAASAKPPPPTPGLAVAYRVDWLAESPAGRPAGRHPRAARPLLSVPAAVAAVARAVAGSTPPATLALHHGALVAGGLGRSAGSSGAAVAAAAAGAALASLPYEAPALAARVAATDPWAAAAGPRPPSMSVGAGAGGHGSRFCGVAMTSRLSYGEAARSLASPSSPTTSSPGTTLVTGGLGGLGLLAAGAAARASPTPPRLILLGRSGRGNARAAAAFAAWPGGGLVVARAADAGAAADAAGAAAAARAGPHRPTSLLHAAGVQVGAPLPDHAPSITRAVAGPKLAAWAALGGALGGPASPLASALAFGSVSALAGYGGQAAYGAANAALDAVVEGEAGRGRPSLSIQWGAWAGVGMAAAKVGGGAATDPLPGVLPAATGAALLEAAAGAQRGGGLGGVIGGAPRAYWTGLAAAAAEAGGGVPPLLSEFGPAEAAAGVPTACPPPPLPTRPPSSSASLTLATATAASVSAVTSLTGTPPDPALPLASQGMDSLAALDLRARLRRELGVDLPGVVGGAATVGSLAAAALAAGGGGRGGGEAAAAPAAALALAPPPPAWSAWIAPAPASVRLRLFCLPYAGGVSEAVFGKWGQLLPPCVQVCPVELPGRGRRREEPPAEDARALAADLLGRLPIGSRGDGVPYALFGACLGGIVAYELAAAAVAAGEPPPLVLAVAAVSPPDLYAEAVAKLYVTPGDGGGGNGGGGGGGGVGVDGSAAAAAPTSSTIAAATSKLRSWRSLPRAVVMSVFQKGNFAGVADMAANPRLFDRVAPIGVADILMAVSYVAPPPGRPALGGGGGMHAVLAFEGGVDATIAPGAVAQWARFVDETSTPFTLVPVPGGDHYFVASRHREVAVTLGSVLLDAVEACLPGGLLGEGHSWVEGA